MVPASSSSATTWNSAPLSRCVYQFPTIGGSRLPINPSYARSPEHSRDYNHENRDDGEKKMPTPAIVDFRRSMKGEESAVAAEKVVKGEPKTLTKNYFSDPSGQFFAG